MMISPSFDNESTSKILDAYLAKTVRDYIEKKYYMRINKQSMLDRLAYDDSFMDPGESMYQHTALFADHGIVHVRDVACLIIKTLEAMHGIHIALRSPFRFNMMKGYGVILAYFHDIGMVNFSVFGRTSHAPFASQELYTNKMDRYLNIIWDQNCGGLAWRISQLHAAGLLKEHPKTILRECIALVFAHSKNELKCEELNDSRLLRNHAIEILKYDLFYVYQKKLSGELKNPILDANKLCNKTKKILKRLYGNNLDSSFSWLLSQEPEILDFIDDIKDTLRALRCADAFRKRGTSFKTSGSYQIFVNRYSGSSIFALTNKRQQMFLLESNKPQAVGESNIKTCEFTVNGDLSFSFYTGEFFCEEAIKNSSRSVALIICDILGDVLDSLRLPDTYRGKETIHKTTPITVFVENVQNYFEYTRLVCEEIKHLRPELSNRIKNHIHFDNIPFIENQRYLNGKLVDWSMAKKEKLIENIGKLGFKIDKIQLTDAFSGVKIIHLSKGEFLFEADSSPGFVYIPLVKNSLIVLPLGGYAALEVPAYTILGITSIISGTKRNASIYVQRDTKLLILPQDIYLNFWHATYNECELRNVLKKLYPSK